MLLYHHSLDKTILSIAQMYRVNSGTQFGNIKSRRRRGAYSSGENTGPKCVENLQTIRTVIIPRESERKGSFIRIRINSKQSFRISATKSNRIGIRKCSVKICLLKPVID